MTLLRSHEFSSVIKNAVDKAAWDLAAQREDALRRIARERLPKPLHWTVDRPRVLGVVYRLRPAWRPTITYGFDGGNGVAVAQGDDGKIVIVEQFKVD